MSLDVWLEVETPVSKKLSSGIFVRENGATVEISREEWDRRHPDLDPVSFVRDNGEGETRTVYSSNITHNLGKMADAAGIYMHLWRPEEIGVTKASELIEPLSEGLAKLKADKIGFEMFNAPNGWGLYEHFVPFVEQYLAACREHPDATVHADR